MNTNSPSNLASSGAPSRSAPAASHIARVKPDVLRFLASMRAEDAEGPIYRFSQDSPPSLLASMMAWLIFYFLRESDSHPDAPRIVERVLRAQNVKTGLFTEPLLDAHSFDGASHSREYADFQYADYALYVLQAASARPRHPLAFVEPFIEKERLEKWLAPLAEGDPWYCSNLIMFLLDFLAFMHAQSRESRYERAVNQIMDFLERTQDPRTGFWGSDRGFSLLQSMAGAYHYYMFFIYWNRDIKYQDAIIRSTLLLQHSDGLFTVKGGGGACEDLDAVDILVKLSCVNPRWKSAAARHLEATYRAIADWKSPDGGYGYLLIHPRHAIRDLCGFPARLARLARAGHARFAMQAFLLNSRFKLYLLRGKRPFWKYSGLPYMGADMQRGDMFSTWFRLNTLALIEELLGGSEERAVPAPYQFRKQLGLGWHDFPAGA